MAPPEWNQIFDLFHAARERSGGERVVLLDSVCGENTALRKAVEELLKEDESANGFLSQPLFGLSGIEHRTTRIAPGQRFGRYVIVALIGRGGMGEVWSAQDTDLDRPVALKFLSSAALAVLDANHITREARAASALNHPGIVTIHEVVQCESTFAIVMELIDGTPLRELCGKPLHLSEVLAIGSQIAEALAAAHNCGTLHGDIKPENILLRRDKYVKVLDFGLARKVTAEAIASGTITGLGTLRYMSPEQARGETLTPATDIFSFGLLLCELTTGHHPYPAASAVDVAQAIVTKESPQIPHGSGSVPARLAALIRAMLAKNPAARPSAKEVSRVLTELQEAERAFSGSVSTLWKWALVAAVVIAACFAGWRWKQSRQAREAPSFRQITTLVPENRATAAAISPDGKFAAYANVDGIFIRRIQDGETKVLPSPADYIVDRLAWFADRSRLVASGFSAVTHTPSIWLISRNGTRPRLLSSNARDASPSPDGKQVAFVNQDWSEIWVVGVNGEERRQIVAGQSTQDNFPVLFWSSDGRRLAYERRRLAPGNRDGFALDADHVWTYESVDLDTKRIMYRRPGELMRSATALPDGRLMFLKFDADLNAARQLWSVKTDQKTGKFLGHSQEVASFPMDKYETLLGLSVTADGEQAMVLRRSDQNTIFVGDFDQSHPRIANIRRLTLDERTSYPHAWTADSRAVIFESNRNGSFDLFKQAINQRTPETIVATPATEMLPQLAPDGRTVLYAIRPDDAHPDVYILMRVPVEGGTPQAVPIGGPLDEFRCALDAGKRCVLRTTMRGAYYTYYDLDPIRGKGRELARISWTPSILGDWDISPDGTHIAVPIHNSRVAQIRVVSLEPKPNQPQERDVILEGLSDLRGLVWAAGGNGWFVSVDTTVGNRLLYVYPDGRFDPLGDIQGWAVPSPDGWHVAFLDRIVATNAWLIGLH